MLAINPITNRVVVEGINIKTIHVKPSQSNPDGGIEKVEGSIHISNVMVNVGDVKDASKSKVTKVGYKLEKNKNGRKEKKRISKVTKEEI